MSLPGQQEARQPWQKLVYALIINGCCSELNCLDRTSHIWPFQLLVDRFYADSRTMEMKTTCVLAQPSLESMLTRASAIAQPTLLYFDPCRLSAKATKARSAKPFFSLNEIIFIAQLLEQRGVFCLADTHLMNPLLQTQSSSQYRNEKEKGL
jgi:hypothetical protein